MPKSIIPSNKMKQAFQAGRSVIGTMLVEVRQPAVMYWLANAGFDFVIIDNEHGPFNLETIADLSKTARQVGITPVVRVPDLAYPYIAQALDAGAQGVMLPRIYNAEQVRQGVEMMKYPPLGRRGCALSRGHTDYKSGPLVETLAQANEETLLIIQIETAEAVENLEEIVSVAGVDVTLIGPTDLSIALGVPGNLEAPELHQAIEKMIEVCQQRQIYPGLHINSITWGVHWAGKGIRVLSMFSEAALMTRAGKEMTATMGEVFHRT